jgi:phospholipid transport system substrate-binding protein
LGRPLATAATAFLLAFFLAITPASADRGDDASRFIAALADRAIDALTTSEVPRAERIPPLPHALQRALRGGGHRQVGARPLLEPGHPGRAEEYLRLFEDYIVASYVDRFAAYTGERLHIARTLVENDARATVFSESRRPTAARLRWRVDWRIEGEAPGLKIVDLVVEGVSMSATLRSDFASIVRRDGGRIDGLLTVLRDKTATIKAGE